MKRVLSLVLFCAATVAFAAEKPEDVVAMVNGEPITRQRLDQLYEGLSPQMKENYERAGGKRAYLNNYVERRLVVQEAKKNNLHKNAEVLADVEAATESILFDRYVRDMVAPTVVPEGDLRAFYEAHKEEFRKPERMHARHIIVTPQAGQVFNETGSDANTEDAALAKITRIETQIKRGDMTFVEAARAYSEDISAPDGGDLGWFPVGTMVPEFEQAAAKLAKGQMSGIVRTQFGYHLIEMIDRQPSELASYNEVRRDIREMIYAEKGAEIMAAVNRVTLELRRDSKVTISGVD
jgi:peptidyl-prolyl cis-trans isomerase C